jgi:hypothetical protein
MGRGRGSKGSSNRGLGHRDAHVRLFHRNCAGGGRDLRSLLLRRSRVSHLPQAHPFLFLAQGFCWCPACPSLDLSRHQPLLCHAAEQARVTPMHDSVARADSRGSKPLTRAAPSLALHIGCCRNTSRQSDARWRALSVSFAFVLAAVLRCWTNACFANDGLLKSSLLACMSATCADNHGRCTVRLTAASLGSRQV